MTKTLRKTLRTHCLSIWQHTPPRMRYCAICISGILSLWIVVNINLMLQTRYQQAIHTLQQSRHELAETHMLIHELRTYAVPTTPRPFPSLETLNRHLTAHQLNASVQININDHMLTLTIDSAPFAHIIDLLLDLQHDYLQVESVDLSHTSFANVHGEIKLTQ